MDFFVGFKILFNKFRMLYWNDISLNKVDIHVEAYRVSHIEMRYFRQRKNTENKYILTGTDAF